MATLALSAAGAAAGSLLPSISLFGANISGAAIGRAAGALAGSYIDQALFGASGQTASVEGPRLAEVSVSASTEGAPIPRLYGRGRVAGQMIWATDFEEEKVSSERGASGGGKGARQSQSSGGTRVTEYRYFANFALAVCEGPITRIGQVWADGKPFDTSQFNVRIYRGSQTQNADELIVADQGADKTPAFRGVAYIVFERLPLAAFGNRIPQLNFEVFRAVDSFEEDVRALTVIPGSGEFFCGTEPVLRGGDGSWEPENTHSREAATDWIASLDQAQAHFPNLEHIALVVGWFGTDLRAEHCAVVPAVDIAQKSTFPQTWHVAGVERQSARVVSRVDAAPAYGGTPSDHAVVEAIQDLHARNLKATFYPFIFMDVAAGNGLPDPYAGPEQSPFPWRGRITSTPAPQAPGSPQGTALIDDVIAGFLGQAARSDFSVSNGAVRYHGPVDFGYRRQVLHYAFLCQLAGGVDAFLLGSELRGLTRLRNAAGAHPFVDGLKALAADVRAILGPATKLTYGADWSEFFGYQPADGSGDIYFNLDPLWADDNIDAIGIDCYWPLSDWRDGDSHADRRAGTVSIYEQEYLQGNISGGEYFDWFYANSSDRQAQIRTPITDGGNDPWIFRAKDISAWWRNPHFDRRGGVPVADASPWVPQSKPFWLTEIGCPAVDRGANQPNVFYDPKSSESQLPYFARERRDDFMQRSYLQAFHAFFTHLDSAAVGMPFDDRNPVSAVYGGRMVDRERLFVYAWDARPYPAFPYASDIWSDSANWRFGHWLNGRVGSGPLRSVVAQLFLDHDFSQFDVSRLRGLLDGYVIDRPLSLRQAMQPLELAFACNTVERSAQIAVVHRGESDFAGDFRLQDIVATDGATEDFSIRRGEAAALPGAIRVTYVDGEGEYRQAAAWSTRQDVEAARTSDAQLPIVLSRETAQEIAERWLFDAWTARTTVSLSLPPGQLAVEPADRITLDLHGAMEDYEITRVEVGDAVQIEARSLDTAVFEQSTIASSQLVPSVAVPAVFGPAVAYFLDLPISEIGTGQLPAGYVAAYQAPWSGRVAFQLSSTQQSYEPAVAVDAPASSGRTLTALKGGPLWRWDYGAVLEVMIAGDSLSSTDDLSVFDGSNRLALETAAGQWEIIQFGDAELIAPGTYRLARLLRGQFGSANEMAELLPAGARCVFLDGSVVPLTLDDTMLGRELFYAWGPSTRALGDLSWRTGTATFLGKGARPRAPVHLCAASDASGLRLTWVRQTRIGGDRWDLEEVPVGENGLAFRVILEAADGTQLFNQDVITPEVVVPLSVFAGVGVGSTVRCYVRQLSDQFGFGAPGELEIAVPAD